MDEVVAGADYGWPTLEGTACAPAVAACDPAGKTPPVYQYAHAAGTSVTGGFVYRGARVPALAGKYVFADFQGNSVWALDLGTPGAQPVHLNAGEARPHAAAIAEDAAGELYVLDWLTGAVYALEADDVVPEAPPFAARLSETGCFDPREPLRPNEPLVPYEVNVELWSDGADKRRYVSLPDGEAMELAPDGHAVLPPGALAIKTFLFGGRPIETRFLGRQRDGEWVTASYEWDDDGRDARLLTVEKEKPLPGGGRWTIPSPGQCFFCHQSAAGVTLGLVQEQLDRDVSGQAGAEPQLARLEAAGLLRGARAATPPLPRVDGPSPLEDRVRAYLAANCSMCHRRGTAIFSPLDLRFTTPFEESGLCGVACGGTCRIVEPGAPASSGLSIRIHARGVGPDTKIERTQMPPIATNVPDPLADTLVDAWLRTTTRCAP